ncbi:U6 snRNA phosphodiesterase isoform X2 [Lingula anatina]|uniref:U6 snRNA phosphodiesterase n=1 Tax=Lingula anatina TaxID=7574 RepID=A0A1S3IV45_LINAN|nr:U6 snRNA phosphodiesterase isoform X2 [Lingula anatina]|eukprot:XP_013401816.1 U6 snRNA phosphodiesterase isoform X2 [Lingula anatina]
MAAPSQTLVSYSGSSSEDDNDVKLDRNGKKRTCSDEHGSIVKKQKVKSLPEKGIIEKNDRLPLPDNIKAMFQDQKESQDIPEEHDGRIRSFPHERGIWATYVYIPFNPDEQFLYLINELQACLPGGLNVKVVDDFHVSLSRTVVLRHHWIDSFVTTLRDKLHCAVSFTCQFGELEVYTNDEKTRSFLGLKVQHGFKILCSLVENVDNTLEEFHLQKYYKNPSFHMSVLWALGDITQEVTPKIRASLDKILSSYMEDCPHIFTVQVRQVHCQTGNKKFTVPLDDR